MVFHFPQIFAETTFRKFLRKLLSANLVRKFWYTLYFCRNYFPQIYYVCSGTQCTFKRSKTTVHQRKATRCWCCWVVFFVWRKARYGTAAGGVSVLALPLRPPVKYEHLLLWLCWWWSPETTAEGGAQGSSHRNDNNNNTPSLQDSEWRKKRYLLRAFVALDLRMFDDLLSSGATQRPCQHFMLPRGGRTFAETVLRKPFHFPRKFAESNFCGKYFCGKSGRRVSVIYIYASLL